MNKLKKTGFTLIEVLFAMLIVSISVIGALKLSDSNTEGILRTEAKTQAYYASMNILTQQLIGQNGFFLKDSSSTRQIKQKNQVWLSQVKVNNEGKDLLTLIIKILNPNNKNLEKEINVQLYNNNE